jgi:hypothetical protein
MWEKIMGHARADELFSTIKNATHLKFFSEAFSLISIEFQERKLDSILKSMDNALVTDINHFCVDFYPFHGTCYELLTLKQIGQTLLPTYLTWDKKWAKMCSRNSFKLLLRSRSGR